MRHLLVWNGNLFIPQRKILLEKLFKYLAIAAKNWIKKFFENVRIGEST